MDRVTRDPAYADFFWTDPLGLRSYPLGFLGSLVGADLSGMHDGSLRCPVLVVAGRGDPLFPLAYIRQVYDRIVAPAKELLVLDADVHLLFVEARDQTLPPLVERLRAFTAAPVTVPRTSPAPDA
jgi:pimeloyl-ACP methyl ester carboxylesterase